MKKCIVCGGDFFKEPLLAYRNMPASAQDIPSKEEIPKEKGMDLKLCQCRNCGLVQLDCEPVDYYKDVIRSGGYTTTMKDLRERQYEEFIERFHLKGKRILEVGAGQGEFLAFLEKFEVQAYGVEHSETLALKAQEKGIDVTQGFVGDAASVVPGAPFDAFLSFNFLEHQPDPNGMLRGIYNNLTGDGAGLVTVPSFEYILENESFYEFIRDHLAYYTEESLRFLLNKNGFAVLECSRINRDTLSATVQKRRPAEVQPLRDNFDRLKQEVNEYVDSQRKRGRKVALWGAGHQGFTLLSVAELAGKIEYIIDSAPFKQGKYSPATHIPIVSPEYYFSHKAEAIIVAAPGYSEEILEIIRQSYGPDVETAVLRTSRLELCSGKTRGEKA